jgi:hypothetical protein
MVANYSLARSLMDRSNLTVPSKVYSPATVKRPGSRHRREYYLSIGTDVTLKGKQVIPRKRVDYSQFPDLAARTPASTIARPAAITKIPQRVDSLDVNRSGDKAPKVKDSNRKHNERDWSWLSNLFECFGFPAPLNHTKFGVTDTSFPPTDEGSSTLANSIYDSIERRKRTFHLASSKEESSSVESSAAAMNDTTEEDFYTLLNEDMDLWIDSIIAAVNYSKPGSCPDESSSYTSFDN